MKALDILEQEYTRLALANKVIPFELGWYEGDIYMEALAEESFLCRVATKDPAGRIVVIIPKEKGCVAVFRRHMDDDIVMQVGLDPRAGMDGALTSTQIRVLFSPTAENKEAYKKAVIAQIKALSYTSSERLQFLRNVLDWIEA